MKKSKWLQKVHRVGEKAAEIRQAVQSAPAAAAQIREAVTMTVGELQQLRAEVQSDLTGLRADSEERLIQAMREINASAAKFAQAGYELSGMDLDLALNRRVTVRLRKFEDVPPSFVRCLLAKENQPTTKAILSGLIKAEETAKKVNLTELVYDGLYIHVGQSPSVRMCWRQEEVLEEPSIATAASEPAAATPASSSSPAFGSFFEQRPVVSPAPGGPSIQASPVSPASEPAAVAASESSSTPDRSKLDAASSWSQGALDRFKKMPDLSKYRR